METTRLAPEKDAARNSKLQTFFVDQLQNILLGRTETGKYAS